MYIACIVVMETNTVLDFFGQWTFTLT